MILSQSEWNIAATSMIFTTNLSMQHNQVDKFMEEYKDIFSSPIGVPIHFQVKHSIDLTPDTLLPNGPFFHFSLLENEEIKH